MDDLSFLEKAIADLDEEKVMTFLEEFIAKEPGKDEVQKVIETCQRGMIAVGDLFENGTYYVGDLIYAGELLTGAISALKPVLRDSTTEKVGTIVLGTVVGDLHDIGKNVFKNMVTTAGFDVIDLGIDVPVSEFVDKVKELKPEIVGMSGLLTMALDSMKKVVDALKESGVRDGVKVIIGGNPVSKEASDDIGSDAYTHSAAEGVKICREWVS